MNIAFNYRPRQFKVLTSLIVIFSCGRWMVSLYKNKN